MVVGGWKELVKGAAAPTTEDGLVFGVIKSSSLLLLLYCSLTTDPPPLVLLALVLESTSLTKETRLFKQFESDKRSAVLPMRAITLSLSSAYAPWFAMGIYSSG